MAGLSVAERGMVTRKLNERRHKRVILRSEGTKDPYAAEENKEISSRTEVLRRLRLLRMTRC